VQQVDGAGDVGVDHALYIVEVLVEEAMPQANAGVGQKRIDRPALHRVIQFVDTFSGSSAAMSKSKPCSAQHFASS
jgi:hypothetical protein